MARTITTQEPTRYELELRHDDGRAYLIAYCGSRSGSMLRDTVREVKRWDAIKRISGVESFEQINPRRMADGYGRDGWIIRFSGNTQRDRRNSGNELPFILDT